jgi:O-acetyl-ADP-ribose deacetylase (regulator of RNase III)
VLGLRHYRGVAVDLFQGDLTQFVCDAMVNAANERLAGGSGVDGAIHRAGGPSIMAECRKVGRCPTGQAVVTGAGDLPAKYVIHTVGPVWAGGSSGEAEMLRAAYQNSLRQADQLGVRHVSFPSLSTGAYGYPVEAAAEVAVGAVKGYLEGERAAPAVKRVTFVLFSLGDYKVYQQVLFAALPEE